MAWQRAWRIPALHVFAHVSSTNDVLRDASASEAPSGTTALAEVQTAGRGQHGRTWEGKAGQSLLISVLLRTQTAHAPGTAPIRVGLAAASAVEAVCNVTVQLKWPNDLVVAGRKLGGVLCEATTSGTSTSIVAGIGINVGQRIEDFPPGLADAAVSLRMAGCGGVQRSALAGAILERLVPRADGIALPLAGHELDAWAARDALAGHLIEIDGSAAGTAAGLSPQGELRVQSDAGIATVHTGRVRIAGARTVAHERAP